MAKATEAAKTLKTSRQKLSGAGSMGCRPVPDGMKAGDGTGEIASGRWSTSTVTNSISRRGEIKEDAG